jgi:hypothetical protein
MVSRPVIRKFVVVEGLDLRGLKQNLRKLCGVEELGRAQMVITIALSGVDRGDSDGAVGPRHRHLLADLQRALELLELSADGGDPQVPDGKAVGMGGVTT